MDMAWIAGVRSTIGLATVQSRAAVGIEAPQVLCEVNLSPGLPMFATVGLPETALRESKDGVRGH